MNEISESLLRKAERSVAAAETLATTQPEFAASRAYYAMFYVAEALLAARGLHSINTQPFTVLLANISLNPACLI